MRVIRLLRDTRQNPGYVNVLRNPRYSPGVAPLFLKDLTIDEQNLFRKPESTSLA